jgi:hypothetical protein
LDFLEADVVAVEGLGEDVLARVESEGAAIADTPDFDVPRVLRRRDALWIGTA